MKKILIFLVVNVLILISAFLFVEYTYIGARLVGLNSDLKLEPGQRLITAKYVNDHLVYHQQLQINNKWPLKTIVVKFKKGPFHGCINIIEQK